MQLQKKCFFVLLHVIVATCSQEPSSPIRSRFDYEERLLERVLQIELALGTTLNEILKTNAKIVDSLKQDEKTKIDSKLALMEKKQYEMEGRLSEFINTASSNMNSTLSANVGAMVKAASDIKANATVAVKQLVNEVHILKDLSDGQDVVFPIVEVNEGQDYDPATGKFTASVSGMYLFNVQYHVFQKLNSALEIVHKGKTIQRSQYYGNTNSNDWPCVTMQVSAIVDMGDQVWVRTTRLSKFDYDEKGYNLFSGTLIHI